MIKNATFVSEWDGGYATFRTDCKVDMDTGRVFDIEQVDVSGFDLNSLDYECVEISKYYYDVDYNDNDDTYSIVDYCAEELQDALMLASIEEFEEFCGFSMDGDDTKDNRLSALYDVIPQMPDDIIMEYWRKHYM